MSATIGAITVGQSPRLDVTRDIAPLLGDIALLERGALDGLSARDIAAFAPAPGDYILVSRLRDGTEVTFAEKHILPRLQGCIDELSARGCELIVFLCTGRFPQTFEARVPLLFPSAVLEGLVPALAPRGRIAVLTPGEAQLAQSHEKWSGIAHEVRVEAASPYAGEDAVARAAEALRGHDCELIVLDCIGYTVRMKQLVRRTTGKPVVLSRTATARAVRELID